MNIASGQIKTTSLLYHVYNMSLLLMYNNCNCVKTSAFVALDLQYKWVQVVISNGRHLLYNQHTRSCHMSLYKIYNYVSVQLETWQWRHQTLSSFVICQVYNIHTLRFNWCQTSSNQHYKDLLTHRQLMPILF